MRISSVVLATSLTVSCAGGSPPSATHAAPRSLSSLPQTLPAAASTTPRSEEPTTREFSGRFIETACNKLDDDGDGSVDVLLPVAANHCEASGPGVCRTGIALCLDGTKLCRTRAPSPEVFDGLDNDCNGVVDDLRDRNLVPRAILLAPRYAWTDAARDIARVRASLVQSGIPFDQQAPNTDWYSTLDKLGDYALAVIPGYLLSSVVKNVHDKLTRFVENGGVLMVFKPIKDESMEALTLAGLQGSTRRRDVLDVRWDHARVVQHDATSWIDSPEELTVGINSRQTPEAEGVEVWTYTTEPQTTVLARGLASSGTTEAVWTRRALGEGSVYASGHDGATFSVPKCYVHCFEPSGDQLRLMLEGAFREATRGHLARLHPSPNGADSVLLLTHDANTHESQNAGTWGEAGALQFARVEKQRGVRGTYFLMTDYQGRHFNPKTLQGLCDLGMCPVGIQGVAQVPNFSRLPDGIVKVNDQRRGQCKETLATYGRPSLCGEVTLSRQLVAQATRLTPRAWRSPRMAQHTGLFDVLAAVGILYDSSFAIGDIPVNLPIDASTDSIQQRRLHGRPILEFPLAIEDGLDPAPGSASPRVELAPSTEARFRNTWDYVIGHNARNNSWTTLRMQPTRGENMPEENLAAKAAMLDRILASLPNGVTVRALDEAGDFWRARSQATLEVRYESGLGYVGRIRTGGLAVSGLTLEFGDTIARFECAGCGTTKVLGKRVVLLDALATRAVLEFRALR